MDHLTKKSLIFPETLGETGHLNKIEQGDSTVEFPAGVGGPKNFKLNYFSFFLHNNCLKVTFLGLFLATEDNGDYVLS